MSRPNYLVASEYMLVVFAQIFPSMKLQFQYEDVPTGSLAINLTELIDILLVKKTNIGYYHIFLQFMYLLAWN